MRINRQRKVNKILKFYFNNFGFKKPFRILLDGTFCNAALQSKININDQLVKYLSGEIKVVTTPCAILEVEKLGPAVYGAMLILKQFPVHQCGHKTPVLATKCLKTMIASSNENKYMLATQDRDLQEFARKIPGVPLIFIFNKAPTLDTPNEMSLFKANQHVHQCCAISQTETETIQKMKEVLLEPTSTPFIKRKRKAKGPNPLSCKKKKKRTDQGPKKDEGIKK